MKGTIKEREDLVQKLCCAVAAVIRDNWKDEEFSREERLETFFEGVAERTYRTGNFTADDYKELADLIQLDGPNKKEDP